MKRENTWKVKKRETRQKERTIGRKEERKKKGKKEKYKTERKKEEQGGGGGGEKEEKSRDNIAISGFLLKYLEPPPSLSLSLSLPPSLVCSWTGYKAK